MGSNLKYMVVGAAPLSPKISQLISATGIQIVEGYGMTEAAPFISANRFEPGLNKFGTVGLADPGVNVKLMQIQMKKEKYWSKVLISCPVIGINFSSPGILLPKMVISGQGCRPICRSVFLKLRIVKRRFSRLHQGSTSLLPGTTVFVRLHSSFGV